MKNSFKLLAALSTLAAFASAASAATINLTPESPTYLYYGLQGVDDTPTLDPNAVFEAPAAWTSISNSTIHASIDEAMFAAGSIGQGFVKCFPPPSPRLIGSEL